MRWLFYILILICILSGTVSEICPFETCIAVCCCIALGVFFEIKNIHKAWLNRLIGILLFLGMTAFEIFQGDGFQAVILGMCLDIVWALLGYRALSHEKTSDKIQVAILAILPLACVAFSLQAMEFIAFLLAYFFILFAYLTNLSLASPTTGSLACVDHPVRKYARYGRKFWGNMFGMMAVALLVGSLLFLVIPRYGADSNSSVPGVEQPKGAFPDVDLDRTGKIQLDPALLFRANVPKNADGYYWKIDVQNVFNGKKWWYYQEKPVSHEVNAPGILDRMIGANYQVEFVREWNDRRLPTINGTSYVDAPVDARGRKPRFFQEDSGVWRRISWRYHSGLMEFSFWYDNPDSLPLKAFRALDKFSDDSDEKAVARQYSSSFIWPSKEKIQPQRQKLISLAHEIVKDAKTDREKAERVRDYLKANYQYSLNRPERNLPIVEDFLFNQKFGHCEVFSTTMAVLLAIEGVHVRNVTGFVSSEFRDGYNNVRSAHAHSWVEVYLDGEWVVFDPTPSGAQVIEPGLLLRIDDWFSTYQTKYLYQWLAKNGLLMLAFLLGFFVLCAFAAFTVRYFRKRLAPVDEVYEKSWSDLMVKCAKSDACRALAVRSLENWWSDEMPEYKDIQAFAREYIRMRYAKHDEAEDSAYSRFVRNRRILQRASEIARKL